MEWQTGLIELDKGIYAYIQPRGGIWFIANAGLIVGRDFSIVIDSLTNEKMAMDFLSSIRKVTDKPIRFLINTHYHGDHTWTNHLFNAVTISHVNTRRLIEEEMRTNVIGLYEKLFPRNGFQRCQVYTAGPGLFGIAHALCG
ncbi:MBL fold metallo-hydrolase [Vulcanisaeta distributa]|uniref:MBL fold metallo-hydrolase n=1 Tax=Vulcanisaeta distributa TaxID=164451 RepID=UPI001FB3C577|nr:MBL fold metallo-hydrolase [Vulcanisaeta distributa]